MFNLGVTWIEFHSILQLLKETIDRTANDYIEYSIKSYDGFISFKF